MGTEDIAMRREMREAASLAAGQVAARHIAGAYPGLPDVIWRAENREPGGGTWQITGQINADHTPDEVRTIVTVYAHALDESEPQEMRHRDGTIELETRATFLGFPVTIWGVIDRP